MNRKLAIFNLVVILVVLLSWRWLSDLIWWTRILCNHHVCITIAVKTVSWSDGLQPTGSQPSWIWWDFLMNRFFSIWCFELVFSWICHLSCESSKHFGDERTQDLGSFNCTCMWQTSMHDLTHSQFFLTQDHVSRRQWGWTAPTRTFWFLWRFSAGLLGLIQHSLQF